MGFFERFLKRRQERRAVDRPVDSLAREEEKKASSKRTQRQSCVASRLASLLSCFSLRGGLSLSADRDESSRHSSRLVRWQTSAALDDYIISARQQQPELNMFQKVSCSQPLMAVSGSSQTATQSPTMRVTVTADVHAAFNVSAMTTDTADTSVWSEDVTLLQPHESDVASAQPHDDSFSSLDALWPSCDVTRLSSCSSLDLNASTSTDSDSDSLGSVSSLDDNDDSLYDVTRLDDTDTEYDIACPADNDVIHVYNVPSRRTYIVTRDDNVMIIECVPYVVTQDDNVMVIECVPTSAVL